MDEVMSDPVVEEYLNRLQAAAQVLPEDRRRELVDEIAAHIAESRTSGATSSEADVRTLLDRLGEPEEIVAAAQDDDGTEWRPAGAGFGVSGPPGFGQGQPGFAPNQAVMELRRPGIGLEIGAVVLMTAGSIILIVGWLAGVVLLWTSARWRTWEKLLATLVVPGGPLLAVYAATFVSSGGSTYCTTTASTPVHGATTATEHCTHSGSSMSTWIGLPLLGFWLIAPVVIAIMLLVKARNRAAAEPAVQVWRNPPGPTQRRPLGPAQWGALEIVAVALLTAGAFALPGVGPIVGLVCTWASSAWTTREKWIATAIAAVPIVVGLVFFVLLFSVAL